MNAETFIRKSRLRWAHDQGCRDCDIAKKGKVSAWRLGRGKYKHQRSNPGSLPFTTGRHVGPEYRSNQLTAPNHNGHDTEGFFLQPDKNCYRGEGLGAPIYFEYERGRYIVYWFFFGYDDGPSKQNHEGDWENITIVLQGRRPIRVVFYAHGHPQVLEWEKVRKYHKTHPIVFSAKGTHASYPTDGEHKILLPVLLHDHAKKGSAWKTWQKMLNVRKQPWYGYGGAWGEVGEFSATTGPLGPSPYKRAVP